jgi:hypothetical protein
LTLDPVWVLVGFMVGVVVYGIAWAIWADR